MYGSKSDYFFKSIDLLKIQLKKMKLFLYLKEYNTPEQKVYARAFTFFMSNPEKFDGATIVKDLHDLPKLDLDALLHDYHFVVCNVASNFKYKWKANWLYAKGNERKGKGLYSAYSRFAGLCIASLYFVPYTYLTRGGMTKEQKIRFLVDYKILLK